MQFGMPILIENKTLADNIADFNRLLSGRSACLLLWHLPCL